MEVSQYRIAFPYEFVWPHSDNTIRDGMLLFEEESANFLAQPFDGNYAYYAIKDCSAYNLKSEIELLQNNRFSHWHFPSRLGFKNRAKDEEHFQKRLALLTPKELLAVKTSTEAFKIDVPTLEKPFQLIVRGNDDSSYSRFFASQEEANEHLELLLAIAPVKFPSDFDGFVFTN